MATFTQNSQTLLMNPGDKLTVHIFDAPAPGGGHALEVRVNDLTTGKTGFMQASAANGYAATGIADCWVGRSTTSRSTTPHRSRTSCPGRRCRPTSAPSSRSVTLSPARTCRIRRPSTCSTSQRATRSGSRATARTSHRPTAPRTTRKASEVMGSAIRGATRTPPSTSSGSRRIRTCRPSAWPSSTAATSTSTSPRLARLADQHFGDGQEPGKLRPVGAAIGRTELPAVVLPDGRGPQRVDLLAGLERLHRASERAGKFYPYWSTQGSGLSCKILFGNVASGHEVNNHGKDAQYGKDLAPEIGYDEFEGRSAQPFVSRHPAEEYQRRRAC